MLSRIAQIIARMRELARRLPKWRYAMYHCPDCATELAPAESASRSETAPSGLSLDTQYYHCPGCGHEFLYRKKEYADREPSGEWYHMAEGKILLMHAAPIY